MSLVRVLRGEQQQLRADRVGVLVAHLGAEEDDPLLQQAGRCGRPSRSRLADLPPAAARPLVYEYVPRARTYPAGAHRGPPRAPVRSRRTGARPPADPRTSSREVGASSAKTDLGDRGLARASHRHDATTADAARPGVQEDRETRLSVSRDRRRAGRSAAERRARPAERAIVTDATTADAARPGVQEDLVKHVFPFHQNRRTSGPEAQRSVERGLPSETVGNANWPGPNTEVSEPDQLTRGINPWLPPPKQSSSSCDLHEVRPPERSPCTSCCVSRPLTMGTTTHSPKLALPSLPPVSSVPLAASHAPLPLN